MGELADAVEAVAPDWTPRYYREPLELVRGEGRHVWDGDGQPLPRLLRRHPHHDDRPRRPRGHRGGPASRPASSCTRSTLYLSRPLVELAERIAELSGIPDARVFFTTSGTEANEAALLLATAYRRSNQVLALRNSYHGRSFGTVAITGNRAWSPTQPQRPGRRLRARRPTGCAARSRDLDDAAFTAACVAGPARRARPCARRATWPACIAEPIQGVGGFCVAARRATSAPSKEVLDAHGILFVTDEVQTGWGRTGEHFWGYQAHGVAPDMLTFAKGVGNGLSLGGRGRPRRGDELPRRQLASRPSAATRSPCAGALANLELPARPRPAGQRPQDRPGASSTGCGQPADRYPFVGRGARARA